ncbi:nose resistant to fluoxetine protein 6-like [Trichogramma pretiosum]|uniref:nose resistant to fluoxetine protein 6-like n=1 Tax=Trichogramma pretiosum TaxID=7493 RepID=UPI0006C996C8|nr:nose resistant to fluoxetine protein 6-like [Trichogramma pretiosum]
MWSPRAAPCQPPMLLSAAAAAILTILILAPGSRADYQEFLLNEQIEDKLNLLRPANIFKTQWLLEGRDDDHLARPINSSCASDLSLFIRALGNREPWALKMLDASSKVPSGLLQGHVIDMGMYDECLEVAGRHCMYELNPTMVGHDEHHFPLNPTLSLCLPASCSAQDVYRLLNDTIASERRLQSLGISVASATCTTVESKSSDSELYCLVIVMVIYIGFLVMCTLLDLRERQEAAERADCKAIASKSDAAAPETSTTGLTKTLVRFSFVRNAEAVLSTKVHEGNLPVINGIRVISTAWIVLFHEYFVQLFGVNVNVLDIPKWFSSRRSLYPLVGVFAVDTFLALSGFLMTYTFFKQIEKKKTFNVFLYYLHRFIRLTLPVAALVAITIILLPRITTGARLEWLQDIFVSGCRSKWWSILLYVQNFVEKDNYCLLHLWSLSVDMQLLWVSPVILLPLYRSPKVGMAIALTLFVTSIATSAALVGINKYSAIYLTRELNMPQVLGSFRDVYEMSYTRASPWLMGVLFGYEVTYKKIKPNKIIICCGWILSIAAFIFCILGTASFTYASYQYSPIWEIVFAAAARPAWAFGICWIIYASIHKSAGLLAKFLSWKIFLPLSRISYSIYLVHIIFPMIQIAALRAPRFFNEYSIIHSYISNLGLSIVAAFFFSLTFEVPMLIFEDIIFGSKKAVAATETRKSQ